MLPRLVSLLHESGQLVLMGGLATERDVLRKLTVVFTEFEARLEQTPLLRKLARGRFTLEDYRGFLVQLRQQVKDGALWMSRAASNARVVAGWVFNQRCRGAQDRG